MSWANFVNICLWSFFVMFSYKKLFLFAHAAAIYWSIHLVSPQNHKSRGSGCTVEQAAEKSRSKLSLKKLLSKRNSKGKWSDRKRNYPSKNMETFLPRLYCRSWSCFSILVTSRTEEIETVEFHVYFVNIKYKAEQLLHFSFPQVWYGVRLAKECHHCCLGLIFFLPFRG
jgi:hypothetical protein